jgi:tetratricopeptide (TPR) repeat protein
MGSFVFFNRSTTTGMEYLKEAERIDPYSPRVLSQLCLINAFILEVETAEAYCTKIGEVSPGSPMQHSGKAFAKEFNGELASAIFQYRESIKLDPNDYEIPSIISLNWVSLGDLEQAEAWLEKAEENGQGQPYPLMARMEILLYREQFGMAADLAQRTLERKLDNRMGTQHGFEDIWLTSLVQQGKMNDGIAYLREKHPGFFESPPDYGVDTPQDAEDLFQTAYLMKLEGSNPEQADQMLEAAEAKWAIRDERVFPWQSHINRARVASMRGDKDAAIQHLYSAFETNHRSQWRLRILGRMSLLPLHDEPEFKRLVAIYEADMDRQREEAYELLGISK